MASLEVVAFLPSWVVESPWVWMYWGSWVSYWGPHVVLMKVELRSGAAAARIIGQQQTVLTSDWTIGAAWRAVGWTAAVLG
mmetsp:Transcript_14801/g.19524  ORF Transcript_14801/g.19524 Transcript_14801/m.19524 type:complete len:81 (-) Transcript_14801:1995-2237(-)